MQMKDKKSTAMLTEYEQFPSKLRGSLEDLSPANQEQANRQKKEYINIKKIQLSPKQKMELNDKASDESSKARRGKVSQGQNKQIIKQSVKESTYYQSAFRQKENIRQQQGQNQKTDIYQQQIDAYLEKVKFTKLLKYEQSGQAHVWRVYDENSNQIRIAKFFKAKNQFDDERKANEELKKVIGQAEKYFNFLDFMIEQGDENNGINGIFYRPGLCSLNSYFDHMKKYKTRLANQPLEELHRFNLVVFNQIAYVLLFLVKFIIEICRKNSFYHGDLKEHNVVLARTSENQYDLRIIDFSARLGKHNNVHLYTPGYINTTEWFKNENSQFSQDLRVAAELKCVHITMSKILPKIINQNNDNMTTEKYVINEMNKSKSFEYKHEQLVYAFYQLLELISDDTKEVTEDRVREMAKQLSLIEQCAPEDFFTTTILKEYISDILESNENEGIDNLFNPTIDLAKITEKFGESIRKGLFERGKLILKRLFLRNLSDLQEQENIFQSYGLCVLYSAIWNQNEAGVLQDIVLYINSHNLNLNSTISTDILCLSKQFEKMVQMKARSVGKDEKTEQIDGQDAIRKNIHSIKIALINDSSIPKLDKSDDQQMSEIFGIFEENQLVYRETCWDKWKRLFHLHAPSSLAEEMYDIFYDQLIQFFFFHWIRHIMQKCQVSQSLGLIFSSKLRVLIRYWQACQACQAKFQHKLLWINLMFYYHQLMHQFKSYLFCQLEIKTDLYNHARISSYFLNYLKILDKHFLENVISSNLGGQRLTKDKQLDILDQTTKLDCIDSPIQSWLSECVQRAMHNLCTRWQNLMQSQEIEIALGVIGEMYENLHDYSFSLHYKQALLQYLLEQERCNLSISLCLVHLYGQLGFLSKELTDYPLAQHYYSEKLRRIEFLFGENFKDNQLCVQAYQELGKVYELNNQSAEAQQYYEKAQWIRMKSMNNDEEAKIQEAIAYFDMGKVQNLELNRNQALEYFLKAEQIYKEYKNPSARIMKLEAQLRFQIGRLYLNIGDNVLAKQYLERAFGQYQKVYGDNWNRCSILGEICYTLAHLYLDTQDIEKALQYINQSIQIFETQNCLNSKGNLDKAECYNTLGLIWQKYGDIQQAITNFEIGLTQAQNFYGNDLSKYGIEVAKIANNLGMAYNDCGNFQLAIQYHQQSEDIQNMLQLPDQDSKQKRILTLHNLAMLHIKEGVFQKGAACLEKTKQLIEEIPHTNPSYIQLKAENLTYQGLVEVEKPNFRKGAEYFKQALDLSLQMCGDEWNSNIEVANLYNNLGVTYEQMNLLEESEKHLLIALKIKEKIFGILSEQQPSVSETYGHLGTLYSTWGKYEKAWENLKKAKKILKRQLGQNYKTSTNRQLLIIFIYLGFAYLSPKPPNQRPYKAIKYFENQALERLNQISQQGQVVTQYYEQIYFGLSQAYSAARNQRQAQFYRKKYEEVVGNGQKSQKYTQSYQH